VAEDMGVMRGEGVVERGFVGVQGLYKWMWTYGGRV